MKAASFLFEFFEASVQAKDTACRIKKYQRIEMLFIKIVLF